MKANAPIVINDANAIDSTPLDSDKSVQSVSLGNTGITNEGEPDLLFNRLLEAEIDLNLDLPPSPICLTVLQEGEQCTFGTLGNFSLIMGKAKSRKTFLTSLLIAASLKESPVQNKIQGHLPADQPVVLLFDTEQSEYHASLAAKRALELIETKKTKNFRAFCLREYTPSERLKLIESGIRKIKHVGLIVIDGIRDLVTSINDEEQASMLVGKLLQWSKELNVHIVCVLHQNKGDNNARGHLGTEAQNKAETVISVIKEKDRPDLSKVQSDYCRDNGFLPFAFQVDQNGLPQLLNQWTNTTTAKTKTPNPEQLSLDKHKEIINKAFNQKRSLRYSELLTELKHAASSEGVNLSNLKTKDYIIYYRENRLIQYEGKPNTKHCLYFLPI